MALNQVPAGQLLQNPAPARLNWPAEQMDAVALVDPAGQEYPAVQLSQAPAPPTLYRPAGQRTAVALVDPGGQAYPAVQAALQALGRAVSPLHVPAAQSVQAAAPARLNRPAGHAEAVPLVDVGGHAYPAVQWPHTPAPARLNWPAGQADAVALVEPAGHAYPAVQGPLQAADPRPTADTLNQVPAGQSLHAPAPARLYRPTGQTRAVPLADPAAHAYPALQVLHAPAPAALYWPAGHIDAVELVEPAGQEYPAVQAAVQALVRAVPLLHLPAVQSVHEPAPDRLNRPAGQVSAVALVEPAAQEYPAVQVPLHAAVLKPTADTLNQVPAGQSVHDPALATLYLPAGHTDAVALVEPAGQEYPAVQVPLHAAVLKPTADTLNQVPAGQSLHAPAPARLYRPTGHTDVVALVDPAGQKYPAVQGPLHAAVLRPTADTLNQVPAGQSLHAPAPAGLYLPAGHTDVVALVEPMGQENPAVQGPLQDRSVSDVVLPHLPGAH